MMCMPPPMPPGPAAGAGAPGFAEAEHRRNFLLSALPPDIQAALAARLEPVALDTGSRLLSIGQASRHAYFPLTAVVAVMNSAPSGNSTLLAIVGAEGMIGIPGLLGAESAVGEALVQTSGSALRMDMAAFVSAFHADERMRRVVLGYMHAFVSQVSQTAFCNRFHAPDEQLCTLLLRIMDRTRASEIRTTHDQLGRLAGVRRETVSHAASRLQQRGVLTYHRGHVHVHDRALLERSACDCYAIVEGAYAKTYYRDQPPPWRAP